MFARRASENALLMTSDAQPDAIARAIIDANSYMTLATADASGLPWASPVWFATSDYREFFWVSVPEARHSRNLAARPELGIVVFDSRAERGTWEAVYMSAVADQLAGDDVARAMAVYTRRSEAQGRPRWTESDVVPPAILRMYRATASEHFVLGEGDRRIAAEP
jgi:nitroimidazol reductase NimA-like FMN-containing flavoprotein (pyridoxamine 5'-phosphate oxidase superfamily)